MHPARAAAVLLAKPCDREDRSQRTRRLRCRRSTTAGTSVSGQVVRGPDLAGVDGDRGGWEGESRLQPGECSECLPGVNARCLSATEGKTGRAGHQHADEFGLSGDAGLDENLL